MVSKKGKESQIFKFYRLEGNNVKKIKKNCPRCGNGVFMAEHKDRNTCGKCGFTEFTHRKQ